MFPKQVLMRLGVCAALCLFTSTQGLADDKPAVMKTKVVGVSLFKNGLGFISREGELPKGKSTVLIDAIPEPVHGTFWAHASGEGTAINDLLAWRKEETNVVPAINLAELLEANIGEIVEVRIGEEEVLRGKIVSVPASRIMEAEVPAIPRSYSAASGEEGTLVLLQTENGMIALNKNDIRRIASLKGELKQVVKKNKLETALQLRAENPDGRGHVTIQYLTRGITWAPSSAIDITDPKTARLSAKAEVINETENLDHVPVNFVTGFPNLQFSQVTDPIAMRDDLATFLSSLNRRPQEFQSIVAQQAVTINAPLQGIEEPTYPITPAEGQMQEELFFYEQKGITLRKGERGYYPLFTMEAPYEHVYEWRIGDTIGEQERYGAYNRNEPPKAGEVWHSLRLTNTGGIPWTTSPAMTVQNGQLLGQDVIYYTSPGSKTTVRITQAIDIKADQAEYELERKRNAAQFYGSSYDLVEVQGVLKAVNYKNKEITLTVIKDLSGEVVKSSPQAKVEQVAAGLKKVNPHTVLTWELPVPARGKIEIEYRYHLYVRE